MQSCKLFGTSRLAGGFLFIQKKAGNFPASPLESASWYNMAWRQINVSKAEI